jgi:predicted DsbA family dithiol-disulfide isomerase
MESTKMKVDIWSDIRCPFCYIGKRKFEMALENFPHKNAVEVEWHSFELDPEIQTQKDVSIHDYLAQRKGMSREWSERAHKNLTQTAAEVGLEYNFDTVVVANSFDAHRLIQLSKSKGLGDKAEEVLFEAYISKGSDISDHASLLVLGEQIGLERSVVESMLSGDSFGYEVRQDEQEAYNIGVSGVPFFVLGKKYAIAGAQSPEIFLQALEQTWNEQDKDMNAESAACSVDDEC